MDGISRAPNGQQSIETLNREKAFLGAFQPLGPFKTPKGINFALYARHASSVVLCLFNTEGELIKEFVLDGKRNRTGDNWHCEIHHLPGSGVLYGYKVNGEGGWEMGNRWEKERVMLDPYAPLVSGRRRFAQRDAFEKFQHKVRAFDHSRFRERSFSVRLEASFTEPSISTQSLTIGAMTTIGNVFQRKIWSFTNYRSVHSLPILRAA